MHYDCWDGNIFVENRHITGIIDWERALWADPLMEAQFRTFNPNPIFQKGYGLKQLNESQYRRALWYDVYMMVLIASENKFREYEVGNIYEWAPGVLKQQFGKLQNLHAQTM